MGYDVRIRKSNAYIPTDKLELAYEKMCQLNITHDHQKRGGSWSNGKQLSKHFSWISPDYPETCKNAQEIMQHLGFTIRTDDLGLHLVGYDSKMGQEDIFLESIINLGIGVIEWIGEDGDEWTTVFKGDNVIENQPTLKLT